MKKKWPFQMPEEYLNMKICDLRKIHGIKVWDNGPTITNAEIQTRKWIEERVGEVEWGNFEDFIELRNVLIKSDPSIAWDISKLRKEIFKIKIK